MAQPDAPDLGADSLRNRAAETDDRGVTFEVSGPFVAPSIPALGGAWALLRLGALGAAALRASISPGSARAGA